MARSRKAFTLIELLVVVAIIALLVALLLPALSRAKMISQRTACGTNMRAIALALQIYFAESENRKPGAASYGTPKMLEMQWPVALAPFVGVAGVSDVSAYPDATGRYAAFAKQVLDGNGRKSALYCPNFTSNLPSFASVTYPYAWDFPKSTYAVVGTSWVGSYLYNADSNLFDTTVTGSLYPPSGNSAADKTARTNNLNWFGTNLAKKAPYTPIFGHTTGNHGPYTWVQAVNWSGGWNYSYTLPNSSGTTYSHGNLPPIAYLDGHVGYVGADELLADFKNNGGVSGTNQPNFAGKYGPNGAEPLLGFGTNTTKVLLQTW